MNQFLGFWICGALFYAMVRDVSDWDAKWRPPPPDNPQLSSVFIDIAGWLLLALVIWYIYPRHHNSARSSGSSHPSDPPTHTRTAHHKVHLVEGKPSGRLRGTPKMGPTDPALTTPRPAFNYMMMTTVKEDAAPTATNSPVPLDVVSVTQPALTTAPAAATAASAATVHEPAQLSSVAFH